MGEEFLRLNAVMVKTGLTQSMIYSLMAEGQFPPSVKITKRTVGWLLSEVEGFIQSRIAESRPDPRAEPKADKRRTGASRPGKNDVHLKTLLSTADQGATTSEGRISRTDLARAGKTSARLRKAKARPSRMS